MKVENGGVREKATMIVWKKMDKWKCGAVKGEMIEISKAKAKEANLALVLKNCEKIDWDWYYR